MKWICIKLQQTQRLYLGAVTFKLMTFHQMTKKPNTNNSVFFPFVKIVEFIAAVPFQTN